MCGIRWDGICGRYVVRGVGVCVVLFFFLMIRRPPRSTQSRSSAASDVYKRQLQLRGFQQRIVENVDLRQFGVVHQAEVGRGALDRRIKEILRPDIVDACLLYTSPSPRDRTRSRMPSSA